MSDSNQCVSEQPTPIAVESKCSICGEAIMTTHPNAQVSHLRCAFNSMAAVRRAMGQAPHKFVDEGLFNRDAKPHIAGNSCACCVR